MLLLLFPMHATGMSRKGATHIHGQQPKHVPVDGNGIMSHNYMFNMKVSWRISWHERQFCQQWTSRSQ